MTVLLLKRASAKLPPKTPRAELKKARTCRGFRSMRKLFSLLDTCPTHRPRDPHRNRAEPRTCQRRSPYETCPRNRTSPSVRASNSCIRSPRSELRPVFLHLVRIRRSIGGRRPARKAAHPPSPSQSADQRLQFMQLPTADRINAVDTWKRKSQGLRRRRCWPVTDWSPFDRIIAALRADAGTRNKRCHFPP